MAAGYVSGGPAWEQPACALCHQARHAACAQLMMIGPYSPQYGI